MRCFCPPSQSGNKYAPVKWSQIIPAYTFTKSLCCLPFERISCGFTAAHTWLLCILNTPLHVNVTLFMNRTDDANWAAVCSVVRTNVQILDVVENQLFLRTGSTWNGKSVTFLYGARAIPSYCGPLAPELLIKCFVQADCPLPPWLPLLNLSFSWSVINLNLVNIEMNLTLRFACENVEIFSDRVRRVQKTQPVKSYRFSSVAICTRMHKEYICLLRIRLVHISGEE